MTSGAAKNSSKFSILRTGCIGMIGHYNESQSQQHATWLGNWFRSEKATGGDREMFYLICNQGIVMLLKSAPHIRA